MRSNISLIVGILFTRTHPVRCDVLFCKFLHDVQVIILYVTLIKIVEGEGAWYQLTKIPREFVAQVSKIDNEETNTPSYKCQ
jgi:hypothetical protein